MISYQLYKVTHLVGVFMVILALGGIALHMINGGTRQYNARKFAAMFHGIGLFLALLGGFGLLARLGIHQFPTWVILKLIVWVLLGGIPALFYRKGNLAKPLWFLTLILAGFAAWSAIYKPGGIVSAAETEAPAAIESTPEASPTPAQ